jgi:hypothetical protein
MFVITKTEAKKRAAEILKKPKGDRGLTQRKLMSELIDLVYKSGKHDGFYDRVDFITRPPQRKERMVEVIEGGVVRMIRESDIAEWIRRVNQRSDTHLGIWVVCYKRKLNRKK